MTPTTTAARFQLVRHQDISQVSGIGIVADGVMWPDGTVTMRWRGPRASTVVHDSIDNVVAIHGHNGATSISWIDTNPTA